ncbi:MAG TPA: ferritin [bacterium]|nr:ferritin [bacterium]HPN31466.1 ferritin [bacterium]
MINKKIEKAFNEQLNKEYFSSYLYLSMAAYFESRNLKGFANWMRVQTQEELAHFMIFFDNIIERGGKVSLTGIESPQTEWKSILDAFEAAYKHELFISNSINELVALSIQEKDYAANNFLQWFVKEQVEEEASVDEIVQKLKLLGEEKGGGIFMLDNELSSRIFTPPAVNSGN